MKRRFDRWLKIILLWGWVVLGLSGSFGFNVQDVLGGSTSVSPGTPTRPIPELPVHDAGSSTH